MLQLDYLADTDPTILAPIEYINNRPLASNEQVCLLPLHLSLALVPCTCPCASMCLCPCVPCLVSLALVPVHLCAYVPVHLCPLSRVSCPCTCVPMSLVPVYLTLTFDDGMRFGWLVVVWFVVCGRINNISSSSLLLSPPSLYHPLTHLLRYLAHLLLHPLSPPSHSLFLFHLPHTLSLLLFTGTRWGTMVFFQPSVEWGWLRRQPPPLAEFLTTPRRWG